MPRWIVVSAGTGGTSATIGRYIRYRAAGFLDTKLCVVDPENSVFFDHFHSRDCSLVCERGSRIEGIGRPRVEAGESGSLVSMICDPGERYLHSYYSDDWIAQQGLDLTSYLEQLQTFQQTGTMPALRP